MTSAGNVQWTGARWRALVRYADGSRGWVPLPDTITAEQRDQAKALAVDVAARAILRLPPSARGAHAPSTSGGESVAEYAERWLVERERRGLRAVKDDRSRMQNHVLPVLGARGILDVNAKDIRELVATLDAKSRGGFMSTATARKVWGVVSKMFDDACRSKVEALRVREDNPARDVKPPDDGPSKAKAYLYPAELLALVGCERVPLRWRRIYTLAVYTYARAGELEALHVEDVDLVRGALHIHRAADRETGEVRETKTGETRRVPIEGTLRPLLEALVRGRASTERVIHMPPREDGAAHLRKHLQLAGVDRAELFADDATRTPITFHDLRASGITWRAVRGDDPLKIQRHAGHTDMNTTQRYIREATVFAEGFGDVFPALPRSLLGEDHPAASDEDDPDSDRRKTTAPSIADTILDTGGGVVRESLTLPRPYERSQRDLNPCYRRERPMS